ncbi:HlyD family efflux transporter periplasmic adaptor subunit [Vreelandella arcis]|uniref:Multidrug efflux pump subunit AcrA (Membrane-fusion protein) n=1 Tax=Vreelandella arcis TaxID=416873 RepID=A0A1G9Z7Q0_9GAMM|nr:HlyD family efflux transporter periplasmic adaptor subunit [Halomonas arcis]SDN17618.1 Multidrug efflux pump subunit AcrA (membrane-fusion protein) [Halomonas arcis]
MTSSSRSVDSSADTAASDSVDIQVWLARHGERLMSSHANVQIAEGIVLWHHSPSWLPVALWPANADGVVLLDIADQVREAGRGLVSALDAGGMSLGYPVRDLSQRPEDALVGAVALRVVRKGAVDEAPNQADLVPLMQQLEDAVAGLERDILARHYASTLSQQSRLGEHLTLLASVLEQPSFNAAAMQLTTRLSATLHAERVSLGWRRGSRTRMRQISHSARFNRKMNRIRATESAMDEALDQRRAVVWPVDHDGDDASIPASSSAPVNRAHGSLCQITDVPCALTLPCLDGGKPLGALTIEREHPFDDEEIGALQSLMALCTRALEEKRRNDRALLVKMVASMGEQCARLLGAGHLGYKLAAIVLVGVASFAYFATGTEHEAADAELKSAVQRVIATPFQGYIDDARARAGDRVEQDQILATMDTRDLRLQQLQSQSELAKLASEAQRLRAEGENASLNVVDAQREQAQAELELIQSRLSRANLRAPYDGVVVSGDLTQRLGSAVDQGEELFRVAPEGNYRLELAVDEARIDDIREGQQGELVLSAMTDTPLNFEITRITPETRVIEGSNRFVVEAELAESPIELRPGMEGVARIEMDEARLVTIWTRELVDWLRLTLWKWWG